MALCLAHPEFGYYMRRDPFGVQGDFITAPEVSQIFGELVGLWLTAQWEKLGKPKCTLAELGPGRGTLMADILRATKKIPGFHEAVSVRLMEISPMLKQKQWHTLAGKHHDIEWVDEVSSLPDTPLLLVANEFFDALPIRQFVREDGEWNERMIESSKGKLSFISAKPKTKKPLQQFLESVPADCSFVEYCEEAISITKNISTRISKHDGGALVIDYGYTEGSKGDSLQAMKSHQYHDPLTEPGEADLTAHVDFAAIKKTAGEVASVFGPTPQGRFLMKIGAGQRVQKLCASATPEQSSALISGLERLASPDQMGDLFKVLAITSDGISHAEGF